MNSSQYDDGIDWHGLAIDFNISVNDPFEIVFIIVY